jgi:hypothetical protein
MLSVTQGVDPRVFFDNGEHSNIEFKLTHGRLDDFKRIIPELKQMLIHGHFEQEEIDSIMNGCRLTDAEVYAFSLIHAAILSGDLLTGGLKINQTPTLSEKDVSYLMNLKLGTASNIRLDIKQERGDTKTLIINGPMPFIKRVSCRNLGSCDGNHPPEMTEFGPIYNVRAQLDIGPTSACRALGMFRMGIPLVRWARDSQFLHILHPTKEFEERFNIVPVLHEVFS